MSAPAARVLVVDDEPQILTGLRAVLDTAGFDVATAASAAQARAQVAERRPDAVVLDLVLPDGYGVDVCRELRSAHAMPIIVLSALGDEREKVRALDAGADDYVTKPCGGAELTARLRALLRRAGDAPVSPTVLQAGPVRIDLSARTVARDGEEVHLSPIEFDLLRAIAAGRGAIVTQRQLMYDVWGPGHEDHTHYLRVHVARIRAKLEADSAAPRLVITEPGIGYRLAA